VAAFAGQEGPTPAAAGFVEGNSVVVSVPMAKWIADRLTTPADGYRPEQGGGLPVDRGWPGAAWGDGRQRGVSSVWEWPIAVAALHLSAFLRHDLTPLSKKATSGFYSRLINSRLHYEKGFARDLEHHIEHGEVASSHGPRFALEDEANVQHGAQQQCA
jgi:hypothetical protein